MQLSARNQLVATVKSIVTDKIMAEVLVALGDGQELVAVITTSSVERLGLAIGQQVTVVIKSTEVMLAIDH